MAVLVLMPVLVSAAPNPVNDPGGFTQSVIDRSFDKAFGTPSRAQYNPPPTRPPKPNVPPRAERQLCRKIVQNEDIPRQIRLKIKRQFGLSCSLSG